MLPEGLPITGEILVSHIRSIDTLGRAVSLMGARVPAPVLAEVRAKAAVLIGITG